VAQKDNSLVPFDRDQLFVSLYKSLQHRATALHDARALSDTVIAHLIHDDTTNGQTTPHTIFKHVTAALNNFDTAAAIHYIAFHPKTA
jgi:transcriptional regulator NrdR family protein